MIKKEILTTSKLEKWEREDIRKLKKVFEEVAESKDATLYKMECECGNNKFLLRYVSDWKAKKDYDCPYHPTVICSKCGLIKKEI